MTLTIPAWVFEAILTFAGASIGGFVAVWVALWWVTRDKR